MKKGKIWIWGVFLFALGISMLVAILPFSSTYAREDGLLWNLARGFLMGEIIFREGLIEVVPDRDENRYKEFVQFKADHPELKNLSENELIDHFYDVNYKDTMYKMELVLQLTKKKVVTHKTKIAVPYKYIALFSLFSMLAGLGVIFFSRKRSGR
jgi:hypothetical protein